MEYIKAFLGLNKKDWFDAPIDKTGLTKFIVATDWHIGSKYQDMKDALTQVMRLIPNGRTVLTGDIGDRSSCPKNKVNEVTTLINVLKAKFGKYYIYGNHERMGFPSKEDYAPLILQNDAGDSIGFTHYDLISDYDKWSKYRAKEPGASWLKLLQVDLFDDMDHLKAKRPLPKGFLDRAIKYAKHYGLKKLVGGHFHVESERRYIDKDSGIEVVLLPAHKINEVWL